MLENLSEKLNECFDTVLNDYQRINKDHKFEDFSRNFKVRIQIFDHLDDESPLIDKAI